MYISLPFYKKRFKLSVNVKRTVPERKEMNMYWVIILKIASDKHTSF